MRGDLVGFMGLFSLDIVTVAVPIEAGIDDTCWWIILVKVWDHVECLSLFATGCDDWDFLAFATGLDACCLLGVIR